jgi:putative transposase
MPRPTRNLGTARYHHFINHGVDRQDLFALDQDFLVFESLMEAAYTEHRLRTHAYALMSNHFHWLADVSDCENPSSVLGAVQGQYAKYFNLRTQRRGPLFEPRFLSYPVGEDRSSFTKTARYIHRNPIDITGAGGLGAYRWSSLPIYLGRRAPATWVDVTHLDPMIDRHHYLVDVLGLRSDDLRPNAWRPLVRSTIEEIDAAALVITQRSSQQEHEEYGADLVLMLALDLRAIDVLRLAERLELTPSAVRRRAQRARTRMIDDAAFAAAVDAVMAELIRRRTR